MKKIVFLILVIIAFNRINGQTWQWTKILDVPSFTDISTDVDGITFMMGQYTGSLAIGATTLANTAIGGASNSYITKMDSSGNYSWAKAITSVSNGSPFIPVLRGLAIAEDPVTHGCYFLGTCTSAIVTAGSFTVSSNTLNVYSLFIVKMDANGNFLSLTEICNDVSSNPSGSGDIKCDRFGNLYVSGNYNNFITFGSTTFTNTPGYQGTFTAKFDPSGNVVWARNSNIGSVKTIALDVNGNCYLVGYPNSGSITFGSSTINVNSSPTDIFIYTAKYSALGAEQFINTASVPNMNCNTIDAYDIAADSLGNYYVTGIFAGTATFNSNQISSRSNASACGSVDDIFVAKYNSFGVNAWVRKGGSNQTGESGEGIIVSQQQEPIAIGYFCNSAQFGSLSVSTGVTNVNQKNGFIARYNSSGGEKTLNQIGSGTSTTFPESITIDKNQSIYIAGTHSGTGNFGSQSITASGTKVFFSKVLGIANNVSATVVQTSGTNPMCAGAFASYSVQVTNGGTSPSFQWKINGSNVGTNSPTFTTTILANNNVITCIVTSNIANVGTNPATSSAIVAKVGLTPISISSETICAGHATTLSINSPQSGVSYLWNTGAVSNSIVVSPTVTTTYSAIGSVLGCSVSASGSVSIAVPLVLPLNEDFETSSFFMNDWRTYNPDVDINEWVISTSAGAGASASSISIENEDAYLFGGKKDFLYSPILDFSSISNAKLTFDVAYAKRDSASNDSLYVKISTDCGMTWTTLYSKTDSLLATAPNTYLYFVPNASQWRKDSIDLSAYLGNSSVKIAFLNVSGNGQPVYIDNINVSSSINASAIVNIVNGTNPSCEGTVVVFSVTPSYSGSNPIYQWIENGLNVGTNNTTYSLTCSSSVTTQVQCVMISNFPGVSNPTVTSNNYILNINPTPIITVGDVGICSGDSYTIVPLGATTYTYSGGTSVVSPTTTTSYSISGTDANGCVSLVNAISNVTVNPLPTLIVTGTNTVCLGTSSGIIANGATTYTWNTGQTTSSISVNPTSTTIYSVTGTGMNGCINSETVSLAVDSACANVWPGDANSDGIANNLDVLELGLHYTQTGLPRATASNNWQSYFANNWTGTITNGKNLNHSDCNGDGTINDDDTLAIYNNYGLTHTFKPTQTNLVNPQLSIVPDQPMVVKGMWGTASIYLGDATSPINNINGIAYTIDFDNTLLEPNSIWIEYQNSFMDAGQNLHFRKLDFANGKIFTATTHTASNNVSGFGKIATLHYQIKSSLATDQVLNIGLSQANQSNASGVISPLTSGTGTLMAIGASVGIKENSFSGNVLISPNPTNGLLNINFNTIPHNTKIEVYNSIGALVLTETMSNKNNTINVSELSSGIYYMKVLEENNVVAVKKVVKE
jgi:hypothetical protein